MENEGNVLKEARVICERVKVPWHVSQDIKWFSFQSLDDIEDNLRVWKRLPDEVFDEKEGSAWSHCLTLSVLQEQLLKVGLQWNVCHTVPPSSSSMTGLAKDLKWPGRVTGVRDVFIPTSTSLRDAVQTLINEVCNMWRDESLILHGFPLDDVFAMEILYLIGHLFNKVGLVRPHGLCAILMFYGFRTLSVPCKKLLQSICKSTEKHEPSSLTLTFGGCFQESNFYKYATQMNCLLLKEKVTDILSNIEEQKSRSIKRSINILEKKLEKNYDHHDVDGACTSPACTSLRSSGSRITCKQDKEEVQILFMYASSISLQCSENTSVWLDFSESELPPLKIVHYDQKSSSFREAEVTKFCLVQLFQCARKLNRISSKYTKSGSNLTGEDSFLLCDKSNNKFTTIFKEYPWYNEELEVVELEFGKALWHKVEEHRNMQENVLYKIVGALDTTWRNECLEIRGLPLLSEFSVSIVFLLSHLFQSVRLYHSHSGNNTMIFLKLKNDAVVDVVKDHLRKALTDSDMVQSLVPLKSIFGARNFYEKIRDLNNVNLKKQCTYMSDHLLDFDK